MPENTKRKKKSNNNNNNNLSKKSKPIGQIQQPIQINALPRDIILVILEMSYGEGNRDIIQASRVCKYWNGLIQELCRNWMAKKFFLQINPTNKFMFFALQKIENLHNNVASVLWRRFKQFSNFNNERAEWYSELGMIKAILGTYPLGKIIENFIRKGVSLKDPPRDNLTALHYFAMVQEEDNSAVTLLIKKGFDINAKTSYELTPIEIMVAANNVPGAQLSTKNIRLLINKATKVSYIFDEDEDDYETTLESYGEKISENLDTYKEDKSDKSLNHAIIDHCAAIAILACNYTGDYQTSLRNSRYPNELITLIRTIKEKANENIDEIFAKVSNLKEILTTTSDLNEAVAQMMEITNQNKLGRS